MIYFLKLGGSLITDKNSPAVARKRKIKRLAHEIKSFLQANPETRLVIGHGSGSFGHFEANKHNTHKGVFSPQDWKGFTQVWRSARELNQIVIDLLFESGIPVVAFPPSAAVITKNFNISSWDIKPIQAALSAGLVPVIYGDVIFDSEKGGTILSTEQLFVYLAEKLQPTKIFIAGMEKGVWKDFPASKELVKVINPNSLNKIAPSLYGSNSIDVTGGMAEKVKLLSNLIDQFPEIQATIFSGEKPGNLLQALSGMNVGTRICKESLKGNGDVFYNKRTGRN